MVVWNETFLVEPWPDTPWDRRDLELWEQAAHHTFVARAGRRTVQVTTQSTAADERSAVAEGRAEVAAFFPPSRYRVQNPRLVASAAAQQLLREGASLYLRQTADGISRDQVMSR